MIPATVCAVILMAPLLAELADETTAERAGEANAGQTVFRDEAVVTATRFAVAADRLPVEVTVLGGEQLRATAAHTMDDVLRQIPSFQLLREQSSEVSSTVKTSVAFRGLTGTSASRALVLLDGLPINDPFQGYVRWAQVPVDSVERVEVVRGGSVVWGNLAIGGAIHLITSTPAASETRFHLEVGERSRQSGSLSLTRTFGATRWRLQGSYQESDGYHRLEKEARGPVDARVGSEVATAGLTIDFSPSEKHELRLYGTWYGEERGVQLVTDRERTGSLALSLGGSSFGESGGGFRYHVLANRLGGSSYTTRAIRNRADVVPNRDQYDIPADSVAGDLQWSRLFGKHELAIGGDSRWTRGEVDELGDFVGGGYTIDQQNGGDQILSGIYAQDLVPLGDRWSLYGALRLDRWESSNGFRNELHIPSGTRDDTDFATRSGSVASPSLGVTVRVGEHALARVAAYGGFRAPTLNELYKPTSGPPGRIASNPAAEPEKLEGIETSWQFLPRRGVDVVVGVFRSEVEGLIQNVTIGFAGPDPTVIEPCGLIPARLSCRQRQNVGLMRSEGLELSASFKSMRGFRLFASGVLQDAQIVSAPEQPQLVGKRVEQAADWVANVGVGGPFAERGSFQVSYRRVSDRYDDELEELYVGELASLDLFLGWRLREGLDATFKVVNALDRTNPVGVTGGRPEVGPPRLVALGVRWTL